MAATITIDGVTYTAVESAPAASAPATSRVASPLAALGVGAVQRKASAHPLADAPAEMRAAWDAGLGPKGDSHAQRFAREAAAIGRFPGYSCTADKVYSLTDGGTLTTALHGYWRKAESGTACKVTGCTGKVA